MMISPKKSEIYIIGAGGHCLVILDALLKLGIKPKGIFDDNKDLWNKEILGIKILGSIELSKSIDGKFIVAIGENRIRKDIVEFLKFPDDKYFTVIHPFTSIGINVEIGNGSMIVGGVVINSGTKIGKHVIINTSSSIDHHNIIEDFVHIAPGTHTGGNVKVGEGSFLGIGVSVIPNIKIGKWTIVGAGSTIINDIPDNVTVVGVPGRIIKRRET